MLDEGLKRGLLDRIAGFRDQALDRINSANRLAEQAVIKTAGSLHSIVDTAGTYVDRIQALQQHTAEGDEHNLRGAIEEQMRLASDYSRDMGTMISQQNDDTGEAMSRLESIEKAAREIQRLVNASRMLALNAEIEAARMGQAGRAFGVVASEMKSFAQEMARANASVSTLVVTLQKTLPRVSERGHAMERRSHEFTESFGRSVEVVKVMTSSMQHAITETLSSGTETLHEVLRMSREAISELQFQDPVAQSLLFIDRLGYDLQRNIATSLGLASEPTREPAISTLSGEANANNPLSGDVTLF